MSLMSRTSDTHNHLSRKTVRKQSGLHTVTSFERPAPAGAEEQPKRDKPFGALQFGAEEDKLPPAYKSILHL